MDTLDTIEYNGYNINIHYDSDPINPFLGDEGNPDIIVYDGTSIFGYGDTEYFYLPDLTREEIKQHDKEIMSWFGYADCTLLYFLKHESGFCGYGGGDDVAELINTEINDLFVWSLRNGERLELLQQVLDIKGTTTYSTTVRGCVQGEWAEVLVVASPEFLERTGITIDNPEQLAPTAELYENWAFGNVYGYSVIDVDGEVVQDSGCWGFFGHDHEQSGLLENARSDIDYHIRYLLKQKLKHTKNMVKNHVPLGAR